MNLLKMKDKKTVYKGIDANSFVFGGGIVFLIAIMFFIGILFGLDFVNIESADQDVEMSNLPACAYVHISRSIEKVDIYKSFYLESGTLDVCLKLISLGLCLGFCIHGFKLIEYG